jgi:hypothetical protein
MRGLAVCLIVMLFTASNAFSISDVGMILGRAIEMSGQGDISDKTLTQNLKGLFRDRSLAIETRCEAAYLFTFVSPGLDDDGRTQAVEFALSTPRVEEILSAEAVTRLYRLKGDAKYDTAKFDDSVAAYTTVLERLKKDDPRADYALLRKGWSYINQDRSDKAFSLWLTEVYYRVKKKLPLSTTLLHGLGQAFSENGTRTSQDASAIASIPLSGEERESLSKGLVDGLNYLRNSTEVAKWWNDLSALPWRNEIANAIEESSYASGRRACDLLPLLTQRRTSSALGSGNMRLLESCAEAYFSHDPATRSSGKPLMELMETFEITGEQRRVRYELYKFEKKFVEACREGVHWIGDEETVEKPTLPVKDLIVICQKAVNSSSVKQIASDILSLNHAGEKAFRAPNDPALFLTNQLLKKPGMADALAEQMIKSPEPFCDTLLPKLTTEALVMEKLYDRAENMRVLFGRDSAKTDASLWDDLKVRRFRALAENKRLDAAREFLDRECPVSLAKSDTGVDCQPLWIWLVSIEIGDPLRIESAKSTISRILTGQISVSPEDMSKWIDLGVRAGLKDPVWAGIKRLAANENKNVKLSDLVKLELFECIATGKIKVFNEETHAFKDLEVSELVEFAQSVFTNNTSEIFQADLSKGSPLSPDLNALKKVDKFARSALRKSKEPVEELSRWVDFLNSNSRAVGKRKWVSRAMYSRGVERVGRFCSEASSRLSELSPSVQITLEEWQKTVKLLEQRLEQCRQWVQGQINSKDKAAGEGT